MGRAPCCDKVGLKKGPWTAEEDQKLTAYIQEHGHGSWRALPKKAGLLRCGKSCRLRWTNYLRPDIKRGEFTAAEEQSIIQLHALLGNRWSAIATHLPKRTDNEIKNYWNTHLKKRLMKMGIDPVTHKPRSDSSSSNGGGSPVEDPHSSSSSAAACKAASSGGGAASHMAQWESVRREAEARLAKEAEMRSKGLWPSSAASASAVAWKNPPQPPHPSSPPPPNAFQASGNAVSPNPPPISTTSDNSCNDMNGAIPNRDKSLLLQADLVWPDSWRFGAGSWSSRAAGVDRQESSTSCCCSHDSPTSTLTSLDCGLPKEQRSSSSQSSNKMKQKLSWTDSLLQGSEESILSQGGGGEDLEETQQQERGGKFMELSAALVEEEEEEDAKSFGEVDDGSSYYLQGLLLSGIGGGGDDDDDDDDESDDAPFVATLEAAMDDSSDSRSSADMAKKAARIEENDEDCHTVYRDLLNDEYYDDDCYWFLMDSDAPLI